MLPPPSQAGSCCHHTDLAISRTTSSPQRCSSRTFISPAALSTISVSDRRRVQFCISGLFDRGTVLPRLAGPAACNRNIPAPRADQCCDRRDRPHCPAVIRFRLECALVLSTGSIFPEPEQNMAVGRRYRRRVRGCEVKVQTASI